MPHLIDYVDNSNGHYAHQNMVALIRHFAGGFGDVGTVTFSGTGDGSLDSLEASPAAITETWTLTCTAEAADAGTFSVTGSVSGAMADATVGVPYDNGLIAFTLTDGATDFAENDEFQIPVTQGAASAAGVAWEVLRFETISEDWELILKGKGYSGTEEIFIGVRTYQNDAADVYNLLLGGFDGFADHLPFDFQPGAGLSGLPAHNNRIDFWLTLNPQRIAFGMKVGTPVYEPGYIGKMLPHGRPSQYPYPLVCGGSLDGAAATRFSDTNHFSFFKGDHSGLKLRTGTGWINPKVYPWMSQSLAGEDITTSNRRYILRDTQGEYYLMGAELMSAENLWGHLDGVFFVSGFNNAVENFVEINGQNYVVLQDVWRTTHRDYCVMLLED